MPFDGGGGIGGPRTKKGAPTTGARKKPKVTVKPAKSPVFGPIGNQVKPIQRKAQQKVQRAEEKLPTPTIKTKHYPTLPKYTKPQRETIMREQGAELRKARIDYQKQHGAKALNEFDARGGHRKLSDVKTRQQLDILARANRAERRADAIKIADNLITESRNSTRPTVLPNYVEQLNPKKQPKRKPITVNERASLGAAVRKAADDAQRARDGRLKEAKKKEGYHFTDTLKAMGILSNPSAAASSIPKTGGAILKELQRPTSFVIGAADAVKHGDNPLKGAVENFKTNKLTGSDLVGPGVSPTARALIGFGIDVAVDPLNFATFGVAAPAKALTTAARRAAHGAEELRAAAKLAKYADHADDMIKRAAELDKRAADLSKRAETASTNKGLRAGIRLPGKGGPQGARGKTYMTSGEGTASIMRVGGKVSPSNAATKLRETRGAQALGKISPGFRPAGVSDHDWAVWRTSQRRARAAARQAPVDAMLKKRAYTRVLKDAAAKDGIDVAQAHRKVHDAIERSMLADGPRLDPSAAPTYSMAALKKEHPETFGVAVKLRKEMRKIMREEQKRGLLDATRENYLTHVPTREYLKAQRKAEKANRPFGTKGNPFARERQHEGSLSEIERELPTPKPMFSRDTGKIVASRHSQHGYVMAGHDLSREVVSKVGRTFKASDQRPSDGVYVVDKHDNILRSLDHPSDGKLADGEHMVLIPRTIGDKVLRGPLQTIDSSAAARGWDHITRVVKTTLTTRNLPAYQTRNFWGDLWFAYQADATPGAIPDAVRIVSHRVGLHRAQGKTIDEVAAKGGTVDMGHGIEKSMDDAIRELEQQGIFGTGHFGADFSEDIRVTRPGRDAADQLDPNRRRTLTDRISSASQPGEDLPRVLTYLSAKRRGLTPDEASDWVAQHHIDYGDLSDVEKRYVRRWIPFWTFASRNAVNQARGLYRRPGKFANYGMAMEEGRKQAGLDEDWMEKLPDYYQRGLPIPVKLPGGKSVSLLFPQIPITDINRLAYITNPSQQKDLLLQQLHPLIKVATEDAINYSFFFRGPIRQDADNPTVSRWAPAPWWVRHLPGPVRKVLAGGDQDAANAGLYTKRADYWMRVLPQTNSLAQATTSRPGTRNQSWQQSLASQFTGVKINILDEDKNALNKLYEERNKLDQKITDANQLGKPPAPGITARRKDLQDQIDALKPSTPSSGGGSNFPASSGGGSNFPASSGGGSNFPGG